MDQALLRGELDARVNVAPSLLRRNPEWIEKKLVDVHVILQIPKASTHPRFAHLPELESFARTDKERRFLDLSVLQYRRRDLYHSAAHPTRAGAARCHQRSYKDPEFFNDYKKITGGAFPAHAG